MFKRALTSLLAGLAFLGCISVAEADQFFPQADLPPATLFGRLPGTAGPGEAIPFNTLVPLLFSSIACANIIQYGGSTLSTDNTAALAAAIAAILPTPGGCVYFPAGKYAFATDQVITIAAGLRSLSLVGDGPDASILYWPNASGGMTISESACENSFHVRFLTFTTGQANGGNALVIQQAGVNCSSGPYASNDVWDNGFRGDDGGDLTDYWGDSVLLENVWQTNIIGNTFIGSAAGLGGDVELLGSGATQYTAVVNFTDNFFPHVAIGIIYGSYVQGVTVNHDNFTGGGVGIESGASETGVLSLLTVHDSQFNTTGVQIFLGTNIYQTDIHDNIFYGSAGNPIVEMDQPSPFTFANNQCDGLSLTLGTCLLVGSSAASTLNGGTITGNHIYDIAKGFSILSGAQSMDIENNEFLNSVTTPISDAGTGTIIKNNPGYNPVGVTASTTVGASPAAICAGSSPETHYYNQSASNNATVKLGSSSGPLVGTMSAAATIIPVDLQPHECVSVAWSTTAPTYAKSVH